MKRFFLILFGLYLCTNLSAQTEYERHIYEEAEEYYQVGRMDEVIFLLEDKLKTLPPLLKMDALRLLVLCYLEKDQGEKAKEYVSQLLKDNPYYNIRRNDPPRFVDLVNRVRGRDHLITTASQQAESINEVPVPVTLITEEMIRQSGAYTLSDLLTLYVPGMSVLGGTEMNNTMHGVYSTLQEKILVMLDGHRLNSRTNNSEAFDYRTSLDKIKQVEVLRGPASCLYGNVALMAVVNIITKDGHEIDGVNCSLGIGDNRSYRADFLAGKREYGIDFSSWASVYASDGERRDIDINDKAFFGKILRPGKTYINGFNNRPAFDFGFVTQWNNWRLMFSMQDAKRTTLYNTMYQAGLYNYDLYQEYDGIKPGHARRTGHFDLSYEKRINKDLSYQLTAFLDFENITNYDVGGDSLLLSDREKIKEQGKIQVDLSEPNLDRGIFRIMSWNDFTYGLNTKASYNFRKGRWNNSFLFGLQFENYVLKDSKVHYGDHFQRVLQCDVENGSLLLPGHEINVSPFVQLKTKFADHIIFNGGLRFDCKHRFDDKWLTEFSPRLSLIYNISPAMNLKLSYSHSFVDAPFYNRASSDDKFGSANLKPEHNDAFQLTLDGAVKDQKLVYQSNIYYNRLRDLIFYNINKQPKIYKNAGTLDIIGFEQVLSGSMRHSNVYLSFTYQRVLHSTNYVATGSYIYNVPSFMLNGLYNYRLLNSRKYGKLNIKLNTNVLSKQKAPIVGQGLFVGSSPKQNPNNELSARAIFNLGMDYSYRNITLSANAYNLFNKKYFQGSGLGIPLPQQGFNFMTRISYQF